jgi:hypothetical protein
MVSGASQCLPKDGDVLRKTDQRIMAYIDSCNKYSIKQGIYNVFVLNLYRYSKSSCEFGISIFTVKNEYDLDYIKKPIGSKFVGKEIVLMVNNTKQLAFPSELLATYTTYPMNDTVISQVKAKLYPRGRGGITSTSGAVDISIKKRDLKVTYYENSGDLQSEKSIYKDNAFEGVNVRRCD